MPPSAETQLDFLRGVARDYVVTHLVALWELRAEGIRLVQDEAHLVRYLHELRAALGRHRPATRPPAEPIILAAPQDLIALPLNPAFPEQPIACLLEHGMARPHMT